MTYKAFIFDLDGVITDTAQYHFKAWKYLANILQIPFSEADNEKMKGLSRMASLEEILKIGNQDLNQADKEILCHQKNEYYKILISQMDQKDVFPGFLNILKDLRRRKIRVGVASASKNAHFILRMLNLHDKFDYVADSNFIKNNKPDPEIFLTVANALGCPPSQSVGIEDAAAGVQAIKAAGMFAIGIGNDKILSQADIIFSKTAKLRVGEILV